MQKYFYSFRYHINILKIQFFMIVIVKLLLLVVVLHQRCTFILSLKCVSQGFHGFRNNTPIRCFDFLFFHSLKSMQLDFSYFPRIQELGGIN